MKKEKNPRRVVVCVKKKFETSELLQTGFKNVEIMLLPGNLCSGIGEEFHAER